jgi:phosphoribosylformylglycinamidine synthase
MSEACRKFETPVTGGNVSFYNQTVIDGKEVPVFPTPTIGMIGVVNDKSKIMTLDFKSKGDLIFILGRSHNDIASSEYVASYHGIKETPAPYFNLEEEFALHQVIKGLISNGHINAAHDISDGGLFVALTEMGMPNGLGFDIVTDSEVREDAFLFGEGQGRAVVTVNEDQEDEFIEFMMSSGVSFTLLGHVTKGKMMIDDEHFGFIEEARNSYESGLAKHLEN